MRGFVKANIPLTKDVRDTVKARVDRDLEFLLLLLTGSMNSARPHFP